MPLPRVTKQKIPTGPVAYSLSGGGSAGAWLVGVTSYLRDELKIRDVRILYGTSTGSLVAALLAAAIALDDDQFYADLHYVYTHVNNSDILKPTSDIGYAIGGNEGLLFTSLISGGISLYDTTPLKKLIDRYMTPAAWEAIIDKGYEGELELGFVVVSLQTGNSEVFTNISHPDPVILADALLASANQPVFMPPIWIEGQQYVDGGLRDYNPIEHVLNSVMFDQVEGVVAMSLDHLLGPTKWDKDFESVSGILLRTLDILTDQVYDADVVKAALLNSLAQCRKMLSKKQFKELLEGLPYHLRAEVKDREPTKIIHMRPLAALPTSGLNFDPKLMRRAVRQGFRDARRQVRLEEGAIEL